MAPPDGHEPRKTLIAARIRKPIPNEMQAASTGSPRDRARAALMGAWDERNTPPRRIPESGSRIETFMGLPGMMLGFSSVECGH
jgi:hypothetical protein